MTSPALEAKPYFRGASATTLIESVNYDAGGARYGAIALTALATYLFVTIASLTHTDLLLNTRVQLPFLQVEIPLNGFFAFAPAVLLAVHCIVLLQHLTLKRKLEGLNKSLSRGARSNESLRLRLSSYFFVQAFAGPKSGLIVEGIRFLIIGLMLVALPLATLLYFQLAFLPSHNYLLTNAHRVYVLIDIALVAMIAKTILLPGGATEANTIRRVLYDIFFSVLVYGTLLVSVSISIVYATIPGSNYDHAFSGVRNHLARYDHASRTVMDYLARVMETHSSPTQVVDVTALSWNWNSLCDPPPTPGHSDSGWFPRSLVVAGADLTDKNLDLRERDLRYARLDRSDLSEADLTGADLRYASLFRAKLTKANLRQANMQCSNLSWAVLEKAELRQANLTNSLLRDANLIEADLTGAHIKGAILSNSNLGGAHLIRTNLEGATLSWTNLQKAELVFAQLSGANLYGADLGQANRRMWVIENAIFDETAFDLNPPKSKGDRVRHELAGTWTGFAKQPNFAGDKDFGYKIEMSINRDGLANTEYSDLDCSGKGSGNHFVGDNNRYLFVEHIYEGCHCRHGHTTMELSEDKEGEKIEWKWYTEGGAEASATLRKIKPTSPSPAASRREICSKSESRSGYSGLF